MNKEYVDLISYTLNYKYKDEKTRIDMSYKIEDSTLYIKTYDIIAKGYVKICLKLEKFLTDDHEYVSKELVKTLPKINEQSEIVYVNSIGYRVTDILEKFLIDYLSISDAFMKETIYHKSSCFTKDRFDKILYLVDFFVQIKNEYEYLINNRNVLLDYINNIKLNPKLLQGGAGWLAECPANNTHLMSFSTDTNIWECQQCQKEGILKDLMRWYDEINVEKN